MVTPFFFVEPVEILLPRAEAQDSYHLNAALKGRSSTGTRHSDSGAALNITTFRSPELKL